MFGTKYLTLCRPCAEGLRAGGERLAALTSKTTKQTCQECGRRRFTLRYKTEGRQDHGKGDVSRPADRPAGKVP